MNQHEIIHKYYIIGTSTLDKVMQVLLHLSMDGVTKLKNSQFPLKGEVNLYRLMNRSDPLMSDFLNEKVDFNQLKTALEQQEIPFAFKKTSEGTILYFRVKDKELAKKGLATIITKIKTDPKDVLRKEGAMDFEEKVAAAEVTRATAEQLFEKVQLPTKGRQI